MMAPSPPGAPAEDSRFRDLPGRAYSCLRQNIIPASLLVLVIAILYAVSRYNFALFHTAIEVSTIAVAVAIFLLVWKSRGIIQNSYLFFIGVTFVFIAVLDFLHLTVYQGVGIFPEGGGALSTRLWIAARYMQAVTLLAAPLLIRRKPRMDIVAAIYLVADILIVASIFVFRVFPATYVEGVGLTPFKIISEYIICILLIGAVVLLYRNRDSFDRQVLDNLVVAIVLTIISEIAFTEYASFVDIFSVIGHVVRLLAYYFFYRAIIEVGQEKPYNLLYRNLNESEKKFRALSDLSPDVIAVHRGGTILYLNQTGLRFFHASRMEDVAGKNILDYLHPDDLAAAKARIAAVETLHTTTPLTEVRYIVGGSTVPAEVTAGPTHWEGEPAVQVVIRDITRRKLAEEELVRRNEELTALNEELTAAQDELQRSNANLVSNEQELLRKNDDLNVLNEELAVAQEAVRGSETRLRALYLSMTEGVAVHEIIRNTSGKATDYRLTEVNPAFSALTDIPQEQAIGAFASSLYGAVEPPYLEIYARVAESGIAVEFETEYAPMGKIFHISVFSPAEGRFATVFSDITERKRTEEALRRAHDELELRVQERTAELKQAVEAIGMERRRLYDVLETLPVYVCLLDKDYRMPFANRYFRETFGYSDTRCCHDFLFNLEKPCDTCETFTVMKTKAPHHWSWTGPNGRDYDIYDFPFYDTDGFLLILEMGIDITEQKKAEAALIKSLDELEVRVEERTTDIARKNIELFAANEQLGAINEELKATQEDLQQNVAELGRSEQVLRQNEAELKEALEEKDVLLSEIHHRVKNNLAAFISLISLENTYADTPEGLALKKDLQNRARSMALIHETLYRTRKYSNVDMDVYLNTLVDQIAASYATAKFVRTIVNADDTLLDITRATPCGLIINELVTNSFKYAFPDTFDCIAERRESCTIRISLQKTDGFYLLSVSDNGIGLSPGFDIATTHSLGLKLVNFLAKHQLRAKVGVTAKDGTVFMIRFGEQGK